MSTTLTSLASSAMTPLGGQTGFGQQGAGAPSQFLPAPSVAVTLPAPDVTAGGIAALGTPVATSPTQPPVLTPDKGPQPYLVRMLSTSTTVDPKTLAQTTVTDSLSTPNPAYADASEQLGDQKRLPFVVRITNSYDPATGASIETGEHLPVDAVPGAASQLASASGPVVGTASGGALPSTGATPTQAGADSVRTQFNALIATLGGKGGMAVSGTDRPLDDADVAAEQAAIASLGGGTVQATTPAPTPTPAPPALTLSGNTVDTGRYTLTASTDDTATLHVHDNQTNTDFQVHGDPHVEDGAGHKAEFQSHTLVVSLGDGTTVQFDPTALNSKHVAYLADVQVSKNGETAEIAFGGGKVAISQSAQATTPQGDAIYLSAGSDLNHLQFSAGASAGQSALTARHEANLDDHATAAPPPPPASPASSSAQRGGASPSMDEIATQASITAMLATTSKPDAVEQSDTPPQPGNTEG